ncbi:MAG: hypothetical protein HeimC3_37790 [Candidatus Heimdallarchaeota archaeon LC_3]|nr:MAG: hypothetical protein HeimC3_50600 [Candidatus Heimdallarchaeota archaeon LC_3]OLS21030.1 MAG: hypothetical protein HeimC3_37790 [Candidatus Heimdallarchaeota archaeon LC_3]
MKKVVISNINFRDEDPLAALVKGGLLEKLNQESISNSTREIILKNEID